MNQRQAQHRKSLVGPLLLIGAGIVFLLSNLGMVSGSIWDILFRYWPVLLIIGGLDAVYRREGLFGPVFLVSLGTIILLINLGFLSWDIWGLIFRFWPVLIILAGVSIIFHRSLSTWWGALFTFLIVLVVAGGIVWYAGQQPARGQQLPSAEVSQPLGNAKDAVITIAPSAGNITIHGGAIGSSLISGKISTIADEQIDQQNLSQGTTAIYSIHSRGVMRTTTFSHDSPVTWDLEITSLVPVNLTFELGAGQATLDLRGLTLSHLKVNTAVSSMNITLPEKGGFTGQINGAIGDLVIYIPQSLPVRIRASGGINSMNIPPQFSRDGSLIQSADTADASQVADLEISQAIGGLTIRQLP